MNPARSIGPALVAGDTSHLLVYLAGPLLGAVAGAILYRYLRGGQLSLRTGRADPVE